MSKPSKKSQRRPMSEQGLLQAMQAIDQQVARAMERSPAEREVHGVQKWKPVAERVEGLSTFVLQSLNDQEVSLDSLFICAQVFSKCLQIVTSDLGVEGLGELRTAYCRSTLENIARDAELGLQVLRIEQPALN